MPVVKKQKEKVKSRILQINKKAPPMDLIFTLQNLGVMMKTGLPIEDAIEVLSEQAQSAVLRNAYKNIISDINSGMTLAESMRKYQKVFSPLVVSIINAGEQGGSLESNLNYLADYLKKNYILVKKIKASLFYPLLILILTFFEIIGVIFFVLPQLEVFFSSLATKSEITNFILGFGKFVRSNGLILFLILVTSFTGIFIFFKTRPGRFAKDYLLLTLPIARKLTKSVILTNFSRTFGTLLQSGIPLYAALTLSKETIRNSLYEKILADVQKKILGGMGLAESLSPYEKYFPKIFTKMIDVGEKAGALEVNLSSMYQYYSAEAEDLSNNLATLIEPILLIFIGLVVALLAVSIIVPLYSVVSSLKI